MHRVDSHHHFWKYSAEQYGWISDSMSVLRRDYLPNDLLRETQSTHIDSAVSVQARQNIGETDWLVETAEQHDWIRGVVGWAPLASAGIRDSLEKFHGHSKLKGFRHVVQDEPDNGFLEGTEFNLGVSHLKDFGWSYDILVYAKQLPFVIPFVDRHPEQVFVLDHIAKPTISSSRFDSTWSSELSQLARRPHVYCKFSGVATEVRDSNWSIESIRPYWDVAIEAFGAERLMFGSDWPVCLLRTSYADWVATVSVLAADLSKQEQAGFWGANAIRAYKLDA